MRHHQKWLMSAATVLGMLASLQGDVVIRGDENAPVAAVSSEVVAVPEPIKAPVSLEIARERARTMFQVYASTLDVMHDHYFHANRSVLPARAMEDVFAETESTSGAKTRWIAVNVRAMSVDHEPSSDFEKAAARRIASGEKSLEQINGANYLFAGSIPLHESCVQCHMGTLTPVGKKARFAGLVISIPIETK